MRMMLKTGDNFAHYSCVMNAASKIFSAPLITINGERVVQGVRIHIDFDHVQQEVEDNIPCCICGRVQELEDTKNDRR